MGATAFSLGATRPAQNPVKSFFGAAPPVPVFANLSCKLSVPPRLIAGEVCASVWNETTVTASQIMTKPSSRLRISAPHHPEFGLPSLTTCANSIVTTNWDSLTRQAIANRRAPQFVEQTARGPFDFRFTFGSSLISMVAVLQFMLTSVTKGPNLARSQVRREE